MQRAITSSAVNNVAAARAGKSGGGGRFGALCGAARQGLFDREDAPWLHLSMQRRERGGADSC